MKAKAYIVATALLAASTAFEHNVPMPSLNIAKEVFAQAKQQNLGDEDFSSIYHFLNKGFS